MERTSSSKEEVVHISSSFNNKTCRYPPLWEIGDDEDGNNNGSKLSTNKPSRYMPPHITPSTQESFAWARSVSRAHLRTSEGSEGDCHGDGDCRNRKPPPSYRGEYQSFGSIFCSSFVIAQEFALSTLFLASHRCLVCTSAVLVTATAPEKSTDDQYDHENVYDDDVCAPCADEIKLTHSFFLFGMITLPTIAVWATVARGRQQGGGTTRRNKDRIYYRTVDAVLIAGMLRFLSSVLRTLTASYSSDTVVALAVGFMVLHLMSCDYRFANGVRNQKLHGKREVGGAGGDGEGIFTYEHGRPLFMGGTISINSAFFSAVLLASRCPSDSSSYIFLMETVVLFAYYPEARHIMAFTFGDSVGEIIHY